MNCPICNQSSSPIHKIQGYTILACQKCGHQFIPKLHHPNEIEKIFDDSYFFGDVEYSDYLHNNQTLVKQGEWYAKLLHSYCKPGRLLDVGAAAGFLLKGFTSQNWKGMGLEPNASMVRYGKERLGLNMKQGYLENSQLDQIFDLITMVQVLPHFYDIRQALENLTKITRPGSLLLIETWDRNSLIAKIFGKRWHEYNPPSARHWFTKGEVITLLKQYHFELMDMGRPAKKIDSSRIRSRISKKPGYKWLSNLIPKGIQLPYFGDDLFWAIFRKTS